MTVTSPNSLYTLLQDWGNTGANYGVSGGAYVGNVPAMLTCSAIPQAVTMNAAQLLRS